MLTMLRPGYGKIMQLFYNNKTARLHLREIARQTQLFEPSVSRFLQSLEQEGVLRSEKDGNMKKYALKKGLRTYFILEAFDLQRLENLPSIRRKAIKIYLDTLPEKPVYAVLFGSTAKGTHREDSDIDIFLVTNNKISVKHAENESNALTTMNINTFQISYKDFIIELKMKEDAVLQSALVSGYPLLQHLSYYEVVL